MPRDHAHHHTPNFLDGWRNSANAERPSCASRKRSLNALNTMQPTDQNQPLKAEPTRLGPSDLLAILRDAQAADLTAMKTASIINRSGHQITGFVVSHPETHERCIVEMSACRWLTNEEMWWLMHVSKELPSTKLTD